MQESSAEGLAQSEDGKGVSTEAWLAVMIDMRTVKSSVVNLD